MFKNNYQGGSVVEVFSAQGKDPVAKWRLQGAPAAIHKVFDKEVKGFVYCVEGGSQTVKMQLPEDGKTTLGLLQPFLVLQVNVPACRDFSIELIITDSTHLKKRLYFSTVHKEFSATPLHARIPFVSLKQNIWCNLCIDLVSFTGELFKTAAFQTLDGIAVCANCKLRRIFTMKTEPTDTSDGDNLFSESGLRDVVPRSCQFPQDVRHVTQMFSMEAARQAAATTLMNSDSGLHRSPAATAGSAVPRKTSSSSHVAFGSTVSGPPPPPQHARKSSRSQEQMHARGSDLSLRASESKAARDRSARSPDATPRNGESAFQVIGRLGSLQPHPPQDRALGRQKLRHPSAGWKRPLSSGAGPGGRGGQSGAGGRAGRGWPGGAGQPLTEQADLRGHQTAGSRSLAKSDDDDDGDDDDDDDEGDEGCEPQLILGGREEEEEEVFRFTSPPHSARRGQGGGDQGPLQTERGPTLLIETRRRNGPQPEDDFVGSESDEDSFPRPTAEFGSKVEKDRLCHSLHHQTAAAPSTRPAAPPTPDPAQTRNHKPRPDSHGTDQTRHTDPAIGYPPVSSSSPPSSSSPSSSSSSSLSAGVSDERTVRAPTHCLSPGGGRQGCGGNHRDGGNHRHGSKQGHGGNRGHCGNQGHGGNQGQLWPVGGGLAPEQQRSPASLCRSSLREVLPGELVRHKVEDKSQEPTGSASSGVRPAASALRGRGEYEEEEEDDDDDEQEQRMLASLRRGSEEEEEEPGARGLSASQIHRCAVSISISSDDTSFSARPPPAPSHQGYHYQKEMTPLRSSNPREWMDVISPPIFPGRRHEKTGHVQHHRDDLIRGRGTWEDKGEEEEEKEEEEHYLNLLYDPCLNCYFDPETGKYYELV